MQRQVMEMKEDIVIVGAGIAGLTTALGLHRLGLRCLVLESSDALRTTGFALTLWANAWRALDAVGIANSLRPRYLRLDSGDSEGRCVRRSDLLETLERELPHGTIRYSSKLVSIEDSGCHKLLHLTNGSIIKTKVLIGCDGVNSTVAKWLGLQKAVHSGRSSIRGFVEYPNGHDFQPRVQMFFGGGVRFGFVPCDDKCLFWFCGFDSSLHNNEELEVNPIMMKQFALSKTSNIPQNMVEAVERTELERIACSPLKLRLPWNLLLGNISKDNVCVAGDALHPMTPDMGQGGCLALEDGVVLARCLGQALLKKTRKEIEDEGEGEEEEECDRIKKGLERFANERRWRSINLISTAYVIGFIGGSEGKVMSFLREKFLSRFVRGRFRSISDFDCGELIIP